MVFYLTYKYKSSTFYKVTPLIEVPKIAVPKKRKHQHYKRNFSKTQQSNISVKALNTTLVKTYKKHNMQLVNYYNVEPGTILQI